MHIEKTRKHRTTIKQKNRKQGNNRNYEHEQIEKLFLNAVTDFTISPKGDTILIRSGNSLRLLSTKDTPSKVNGNQRKPGKKSGIIDLKGKDSKVLQFMDK